MLLGAWKLELESQEDLQKNEIDMAETLPLCPQPRPTIQGLQCQGMIPAPGAISRATLRTLFGFVAVHNQSEGSSSQHLQK